MLAFQDRRESRDATDELLRCRRDLSLIGLGILEAAVADVLSPERDAPHPVLMRLRTAMDAIARGETTAAHAALTGIEGQDWPARVDVTVPEGFAYYALSPGAFGETAAAWAARARPPHVVCLGLRSIGTTLASACAAAIAAQRVPVTTWTLRPRGHPFDRTVAIAPELTRGWPMDRATFLIVDEGPGLSGSSFAGTADALSALGVPDDRIVFLAAWRPDPSQLRSASAQRRWPRHHVLTARPMRPPAGAIDLSGGLWRAHLALPQPWPAAHPQHERVKFLTGDRVSRFAGLGDWGRTAFARAERLADAGWTAPPAAFDAGFLIQTFAPGTPLSAEDVDSILVERSADYVAWLRTHESARSESDVQPLCEMLRVNARESLGDDVLPAVDALAIEARRFAEPATAIDGRLLPHEWIRTPSGVLKTDALDHHRDHFLPGTADAAWDVAGLLTELSLTRGARESAVQRYRRASNDRAIGARLPFYLAAYAAFRVGYTTLAAESLQGEEQARFAADRERYVAALATALTTSAPSGR